MVLNRLSRAPSFDFKALEIFLAVFETGGMTTAARQLGLTQSAVSQAVRRLEKGLGAPLFERGRPLRATEAGFELAERARDIFEAGERLESAVRDRAQTTRPVLRIGMIDSFAATAGPRLIRRLRNHADQLTVWSGISPFLAADLLGHRLDMIITSDDMARESGLTARFLMREPFHIVMPKRMAAAIRNLRLRDLAKNHPFVRYSLRSMIGARIEEYLVQQGIDIPGSLEFDGTDTVFAMVSGGLGWAITTPLCMIHGHGRFSDLTLVPIPEPGFLRELYLVSRIDAAGGLADRVVQEALATIAELLTNDLRVAAPWVEREIVVGE